MKNIVSRLLLIISLLVSANVSFAQCDDDDFMDNCATLLDDYTFVKSFEIETYEDEPIVEFSAVFSRDHNYVITVCGGENPEGKKMVVELYDRDKKLISSSYYKTKKMHLKKLGYKCSATGVYYIKARFEGDAEGCGVVILGFKK